MSFRSRYVRMIADLDDCIHLVRANWMVAAPGDKLKYMDKIDAMLDQRFKLMRSRDR